MPKKTKPFVRALCVLLALVAALSLTMVSRDAGHKRRINPCKNHLTFCAKLLKSRCSIDSRSTLQHSQTAIRQTF